MFTVNVSVNVSQSEACRWNSAHVMAVAIATLRLSAVALPLG